MFEIKCENCGEINQFHNRMRNEPLSCFMCRGTVQLDIRSVFISTLKTISAAKDSPPIWLH